jgi:hypothetical protein
MKKKKRTRSKRVRSKRVMSKRAKRSKRVRSKLNGGTFGTMAGAAAVGAAGGYLYSRTLCKCKGYSHSGKPCQGCLQPCQVCLQPGWMTPGCDSRQSCCRGRFFPLRKGRCHECTAAYFGYRDWNTYNADRIQPYGPHHDYTPRTIEYTSSEPGKSRAHFENYPDRYKHRNMESALYDSPSAEDNSFWEPGAKERKRDLDMMERALQKWDESFAMRSALRTFRRDSATLKDELESARR